MVVQPYEGTINTEPFAELFQNGEAATGAQFALPLRAVTSDAVRRAMPSPFNGQCGDGNCENQSGFQSIISQIGALFQQLAGMLNGSGFPFFGNGSQQYFQNASGASVGDPHLSFNGATWDNMQSQPNLLDSNSIAGGFQVSTQTTAPAANGVTFNERATVTTNYGMTTMSLDKSGAATIVQNGSQVPIDVGQTIDLGNGQTVQHTQNGLQITANNGFGGQITTTMTATGQGVDVQNSAQNVDLGGTLVAQGGNQQPRIAPPWEPQRRYAGP